MTETVKKRRRWPWVVLAALLLIGGPIAWRFRPLNAKERALVGTWKSYRETVTFLPDRRILGGGNDVGSWSAAERTLYVRQPIPFEVISDVPWRIGLPVYFRMLFIPTSHEIVRDGPDRFWWAGEEYVRVQE